MSNFKLVESTDAENPNVGDYQLKDGNFVFITTDDNLAEEVRQKAAVRFQFHRGDWYLDELEGNTFSRDVFVKNPNLNTIRALLIEMIEGIDGVEEVQSVIIEQDKSKRQIKPTVIAKLRTGDVLILNEPFIVGE